MRALAVLVMLSACKIADTHFIGLGGDDAGGDGPHLDASGDATLTTKRAYLIDSQSGIFVMARATNGDLVFTSTSYPGGGIVASAMDPARKHLYVSLANPPKIRDFAVQMDGTLVPFGADVSIDTATCQPSHLAVSPNNTFLAVGCTTNHIALIAIDAQLGLGGPIYSSAQNATGEGVVAFAQNGNCLVAIDASASILQPQNVHPFTVTPSGNLQPAAAVSGPTTVRTVAVDPSGQYVYVAGNGQLFYYSQSPACALVGIGNMSAASTPNAIAFSPAGNTMEVIGDGVYAFMVSLGAPGTVPGSPFLSQTQAILDGVFDPMLPVLYLTSPSFTGVLKATVDPNTGAITATTPTSSPETAHAIQLQLGP